MRNKNLQTRLEIVIDQLIDDEHAVMAEQVKESIAEIERFEKFYILILAASEREDDPDDLYQLHIEVGQIIDEFEKAAS